MQTHFRIDFNIHESLWMYEMEVEREMIGFNSR